MWLIDKHGEPVAPAWLWLDARAASIAEEFTRHPDYPAHYKRTGTGINACQMSIHLAWMARHRPGGSGAGQYRLPLQGLALFQTDR